MVKKKVKIKSTNSWKDAVLDHNHSGNVDDDPDTYTGKTVTGLLPSGIICMWSGLLENVPSGWYLCNGNNNTPNLSDKFILSVGAAEDPGDTGGSDEITLAITNLPIHSHGKGTLAIGNENAHTHGKGTLTTNNIGAHSHSVSGTAASDGNHTHTLYTVQQTGSGYTGPIWESNNYEEGWQSGKISTTGAHTHSVSGTAASDGNHTHTVSGSTAAGSTHSHSISGSTAATGSGSAFDNRPAYYKLAFIMKG